MFKVLKRDGSIQDFDRYKIINGVMKSGATQEVADAVALDVEAAFADKTDTDQVSYVDIRTKVLESLEQRDPTSGQTFAAYHK